MNPHLVTVAKVIMPPAAWVGALLAPGRDSRLALRETLNKLEIMDLVRKVSTVLPPRGTFVPLTELTTKCYALGPFPALWAVEGLGHYWGDTFYDRKEEPQALLTSEEVKDLPEKSLTMLHAGIGLSFAQHEMEPLRAGSPSDEIRTVVQKFITLCRDSSRPGYLGAAVESLGLVTRFFHGSDLARVVDRLLADSEPEMIGYFWHGAGRALYFAPQNFIPGFRSPWRAVEMIGREAPHEEAQSNMMAGLAWAINLVNMRHPQIMEEFLKHHGTGISLDAFANGVASSLIMRFDTSPDDDTIARFRSHAPVSSDPFVVATWKTHVERVCANALDEVYPVLKRHGALEEVFRCQSLESLVSRLEGSGPNR